MSLAKLNDSLLWLARQNGFSALAFYLWRPEGRAFGPDKAALHL